METTPFHAFIALIAFDQAVHALEGQLQNNEKESQQLKSQEQRLHDDLENSKRQWIEAKKGVDDKELEVKDLEQKETTKKKRIDTVTNHREYQSLKAELDTIKEKQQQLETEVLEAWHGLEITTKQHEAKKSDVASKVGQVHEAMAKAHVQHEELTKTIKDRLQERAALEKNVPAEWLEKYASMRSRVPDPVVPVINGHCSACVYKVSDQDMLMLSRNKLLQCKDCYRFLYLPSKQDQPK